MVRSGGNLVQASVARCLRTPPYAAKRKGFIFGFVTAYAATATGARLSLATVLCGPITVVPHRAKANPFRRSSILFRPLDPPMTGSLVEPPGTAPGSDPVITSAFIAIVPLPERIRYTPWERRIQGRCAQGSRRRQGLPASSVRAGSAWRVGPIAPRRRINALHRKGTQEGKKTHELQGIGCRKK